MTNYIIQSGMLADLVVSHDPQHYGHVVLRWLKGDDPNQLWTIESAGDNNYYLKNNATGTYLSATGIDSPVRLDGHGDLWQSTGPFDQLSAIRLVLNENQNLNAYQSSTEIGTRIYTWSWDNEGDTTWLMTPVEAIWPRPTAVVNFMSLFGSQPQLASNQADPVGALVVDAAFDPQIPKDHFAFTITYWCSGFSIVNKASHLIAYVSGDGNGSQLLQRSAENIDKYAIWTYGGGSDSVAVRPLIDAGQNWNIFGPPSVMAPLPWAMGTWSWGSGDDLNQLWLTLQIPSIEEREIARTSLEMPAATLTAAIPGSGAGSHVVP